LAPSGQPVRCAPGLSNWLRQLSNPGRVFSSPLGLGDTYKQKARTSVQALNLNMAVRWAAIFTFIIIRVNHNYFFIYNVLSLFFVRWCIAIFL
ncbi:hypothetical protein, partial [Salmonella enterica]|uniref:hypothetical protein n=1 Tax=Salmonella enterica TaxID=28901 RepID=UPI0032C42C93